MKWTNLKWRFEIYKRHMHKSFELCCVLSCFADCSSTRPLTACRVSTTTGAGRTWGKFFSSFFFCILSGFSSGFLFNFVRRQLERKVKEKISYMSPGHSSWPGYNRELLLGRRRPPTKKDILSFTLNHGLSFFSFPSDLYTWSDAELQQAWLGQHWLATVQQVAWDGGIRFDVTPSSQSSSWLSSSPSSPPSSWYIITVQQVASDLMDVS